MFNLPQHLFLSRLPSRNGLTVRSSDAQQLSGSAIAVKMLAAGVCGTDLAIITGARPDQAEVLGHEGVGVVVHVPAGCGISEGTRVIVNPVHSKNPSTVVGHSRDGIFREWFWMESEEALGGELLVSCPPDCQLESTELALAEPVASALYSLEILKKHGSRHLLLIRGSGTVAILVAKLWTRLTGAAAIVVSTSETHARWLRKAADWPASISICSIETLPKVIRENGMGEPDAGILCCTREDAAEGLRLLLDIVKPGATIDLMAGFPADHKEERLGDVALDRIRWNNIRGRESAPPTAVIDRVSGKTVYLFGHRGTSARHILDAVNLLSRKVVSRVDLPQRIVSLEQLAGVVNQMISRRGAHTNWVKTLVAFANKDTYERIDR
jgi:2-epi-valiolone-7-phosphate 1-reductase